jgi:IclR family transcriptional regulator, KDG regulon repressor
LQSGVRRLSDDRPVSFRELQAELAQVRRRGYALNLGEMSKTVFGVGAPIFGPDRHVVAAVGVAGPAERMKKPVLLKLAPLVKKTAAAISIDLGYAGD